jgi:hypothetical protein
LKGLENLVLLTGGYVSILNNTVLESLEGIQNMNSQSISSIFIQENPLLSHCEIKSLCQFLEIDSTNAFIEFNQQGCNNKKEVTEKCLVKTEVANKNAAIRYYPNPFTEAITIENQGKEQLFFIKDVMGKMVLQLHVHPGNHSYSLESLNPGIYVIGNDGNQASRILKN